jgi:4-hydroxy-tetrahydrodipicolinate reductase
VIRLALAGIGGRVGREILTWLTATPDVELVAGLVRDGSALAGQDLGVLSGRPPSGVLAAEEHGAPAALAGADVLVDFSQAEAAVRYARAASDAGCAFVTGTTGFSPEQSAAIRACGERVPVLIAPNMSVGITAILKILPQLVQMLGPEYDLEIVETHHRHKADAPSGTALALADAIGQTGDEATTERAVFGRHGRAKRQSGEIGVHAVRAGGAIGEHRIILASEGEQIEVLHRATSRQTYAQGAVRAARWVAGRAPGIYTMADVIGTAAPANLAKL